MKFVNFLKLIIAIVISELAGIIGSVFTTPSIPVWYDSLAKPALNPPAWVFAPVWTALFAFMGVAAFLVWKKGLEKREVKIALAIFFGQLFLNAFWSYLFFGRHNPGAAFYEIIFLWLAILFAIFVFARISKAAAWLLLPYILWVSFAGYLNYALWQLNVKAPGQIACSMEAKLCPDGSYVSRLGPNCEFAVCPNGDSTGGPVPGTESWNVYTDSQTRIAFKFPETLTAKYIDVADWPPGVQVLDQAYGCTRTGSEIASGGITEKRLVDNREYCRTAESEGAAGSIYTRYAYAFPLNAKTVILTFSLRLVQCGNYSEPQMAECENERQAFDIDSVADKMAQTVKLGFRQ